MSEREQPNSDEQMSVPGSAEPMATGTAAGIGGMEDTETPSTDVTAPIILDVPAYSQLDPEHRVPPGEERTLCSVMSMKMILGAHARSQAGADAGVDQFKSWLQEFGGRNAEGRWRHAAQVEILKRHGLVAWRRNWIAPSQDPQYFTEHEGYDEAQMTAVQAQIAAEQQFADLPDETQRLRAQEKFSLLASLRAGNPVIVSVKAGFHTNADSHQLVLNGYEPRGQLEYFILTDPDTPVGENPRRIVPLDYFFSYFNHFAVFAKESAATPPSTFPSTEPNHGA